MKGTKQDITNSDDVNRQAVQIWSSIADQAIKDGRHQDEKVATKKAKYFWDKLPETHKLAIKKQIP